MTAPIPYPDKTVLVAATEPFLRSIIADVLRNSGISKIQTAGSVPESMEQIRTWLPDAIILDWTLTKGGGEQLTQWIRTSNASPNPQLPIVMVTGDTSQNTILGARDAGIDEIIVKPVVPRAVVGRVNLVLRKRRSFVQSHDFVGPDRRRREADSYKGSKRRMTDKSLDSLDGADSFSDKITSLTEAMHAGLSSLNTRDRESVMRLYKLAGDFWEEAQVLDNTPLETIGQSMITYIQAVGISGRMETAVLERHLHAVEALRAQGVGGEETTPALNELRELVSERVGQLNSA